MKMYKVISYVIPLNNDFKTSDELKYLIENNEHPCNLISTNKEDYFI